MLNLSKLRGRQRDEDEGTWFVSLADLLTLLLCFFVLMLSVSQLDQERYKKVASALEETLRTEKAKRSALPQGVAVKQDINLGGQLYPVVPPALPPQVYETQIPPGGVNPPAQTGQVRPGKSIDELRTELGLRFAQDPAGVQIEQRDSGFAITMKGAVLFDRASADLTPSSIPYLDSIAASLRGTPYAVTVEGHTDNLPIQSFVYPSNWELSAARASRVARYLIDRNVPKERIHVTGYADTRPVAPNNTEQGQPIPENQARNRRVVILINP